MAEGILIRCVCGKFMFDWDMVGMSSRCPECFARPPVVEVDDSSWTDAEGAPLF